MSKKNMKEVMVAFWGLEVIKVIILHKDYPDTGNIKKYYRRKANIFAERLSS